MAIVDGKPRQGDYDQALDNEKSSGIVIIWIVNMTRYGIY